MPMVIYNLVWNKFAWIPLLRKFYSSLITFITKTSWLTSGIPESLARAYAVERRWCHNVICHNWLTARVYTCVCTIVIFKNMPEVKPPDGALILQKIREGMAQNGTKEHDHLWQCEFRTSSHVQFTRVANVSGKKGFPQNKDKAGGRSNKLSRNLRRRKTRNIRR